MPTTFLPELPSGVSAEVRPLRFRPPDLDAFMRELAGPGPPPMTRATNTGWPFHLVERGDRFIALYQFLDHIGVVEMRGPRDEVLRALEQARPDWSGPDVIALSQLWDEW